MMNEFKEKFKEAAFEDDVYLRPSQIIEYEEDLIIYFSVFLYDTTHEVQRWKVNCRNLINYKLMIDFIEDIDVFNNHVLLWEFHQSHSELYYRDLSKARETLIGQLLKKHSELTKGWIEFDYFLNEWSKWMYGSEQGLLASGPDIIISEYNSVLHEHGIKTSILPSKKQSRECSVMIFGQSFVIAEKFEFELVM
jgi:hypothetical protein